MADALFRGSPIVAGTERFLRLSINLQPIYEEWGTKSGDFTWQVLAEIYVLNLKAPIHKTISLVF
jgi:hypothetical protein